LYVTSLTHDVFVVFFQAEDGIRDDLVTGVQTSALPICRSSERLGGEMSLHHVLMFHSSPPNRSEDRRIGFAVRYIPTYVRQVAGLGRASGRDGARMCAGGVERDNGEGVGLGRLAHRGRP